MKRRRLGCPGLNRADLLMIIDRHPRYKYLHFVPNRTYELCLGAAFVYRYFFRNVSDVLDVHHGKRPRINTESLRRWVSSAL